jgi:hypothetical protein
VNEIFSTRNIINTATPYAGTADGQLSFFNNKIKFQARNYILNNYFKGVEKTFNDLDIVKKNLFLNFILFNNLAKYDNNLSKYLLPYEKLSKNIISKIRDNGKISENLDWLRNSTTTTSNFMKIEWKKDIKKFVADSIDLFDYNSVLLSPIQKPHILLPTNNKLTARRNSSHPPQISTTQNQVDSLRFQKYEKEEESFRLQNINDMKIKHTNDSEKLIKKIKTIDDIFSTNNQYDGIDKYTNPKLISLKYDIETILSSELNRYSLHNNISAGSDTKIINDIKNSNTGSIYKESYDYTIDTLKKDLEYLFLKELRKHGVV